MQAGDGDADREAGDRDGDDDVSDGREMGEGGQSRTRRKAVAERCVQARHQRTALYRLEPSTVVVRDHIDLTHCNTEKKQPDTDRRPTGAGVVPDPVQGADPLLGHDLQQRVLDHVEAVHDTGRHRDDVARAGVTGLDIADLGEEHGHRVIRVLGKGSKTVLVPLPPAVSRALDQAIGDRAHGPILLNTRGARMDRHAAIRRLRTLAAATRMRMPPLHPHMLRHTYVTTMLDAGVDLRDVQIAARHADPRTTMRYDRARQEPRPTPQLHPRRLHGRRNLNFGLGGERLPY